MFFNIKKMLFGNNVNSLNTFNNLNNSNNKLNMFFRGNRNYNRCIYNLVNFEQAKNMIETNNVYLIDVRTKPEYDFMHIKNAINIPVDEINSRISELEEGKDLMVYCASGARSKNAIQILNSLGYTNVYIWEYGALATFPYRELIEYGDKNNSN